MAFVDYLLARLGEKSTWVGIVSLLGALGVSVAANPDVQGAIATAGLAVVGLISVLLKELGSDD